MTYTLSSPKTTVHVAERPVALPTWEVQSTTKSCGGLTQENENQQGAKVPSTTCSPPSMLWTLSEDLPLTINGHHQGPHVSEKARCPSPQSAAWSPSSSQPWVDIHAWTSDRPEIPLKYYVKFTNIYISIREGYIFFIRFLSGSWSKRSFHSLEVSTWSQQGQWCSKTIQYAQQL